MNSKKQIPSLGNTAVEVLKNALNFNTAGFLLKFEVLGEGTWYYDIQNKAFKKLVWIDSIPTSEECSDLFDEWLLEQIRRGFVVISVTSYGKNPHYLKEIHRARGVTIPKE